MGNWGGHHWLRLIPQWSLGLCLGYPGAVVAAQLPPGSCSPRPYPSPVFKLSRNPATTISRPAAIAAFAGARHPFWRPDAQAPLGSLIHREEARRRDAASSLRGGRGLKVGFGVGVETVGSCGYEVRPTGSLGSWRSWVEGVRVEMLKRGG